MHAAHTEKSWLKRLFATSIDVVVAVKARQRSMLLLQSMQPVKFMTGVVVVWNMAAAMALFIRLVRCRDIPAALHSPDFV